jgi:hypothetical protein
LSVPNNYRYLDAIEHGEPSVGVVLNGPSERILGSACFGTRSTAILRVKSSQAAQYPIVGSVHPSGAQIHSDNTKWMPSSW